MNLNVIARGGMLARHKGKLVVGVAVVAALADYLTGATELSGFLERLIPVLVGGM